ncbi:glycoside hydrolase family 97 N-terminal domain-containing protein, partial [Streptomyces broussonetiae]|uniref:glycoside hydrolase family 97 N-terminal domain-containing protein n=1 Tax=Streptomyces broussonetiae TaxID=2686304 RepID=UPI0035D8DF15
QGAQGRGVAAATAAPGIGSTYPSEASDASVTATSADGATSITMSLAGGSLQWSARRKGATVVAGSAMGLRLSDATTLGADAVLTNYQRWHVDRTWNPVYGRNATVLDAYQEMRWNLRDNRTSINFGVQIRAYATGVAFRYVLLDPGTAAITGELTTFTFPDGTLVYSARDEDDYNPVAPGSIPPTGTSSTDTGPLTDLPLTATYSGGLIACVGAATFSSPAATGSRKAESDYRMDGHEGNEARRAATVAQARTGHGYSLGAASRRCAGVPGPDRPHRERNQCRKGSRRVRSRRTSGRPVRCRVGGGRRCGCDGAADGLGQSHGPGLGLGHAVACGHSDGLRHQYRARERQRGGPGRTDQTGRQLPGSRHRLCGW